MNIHYNVEADQELGEISIAVEQGQFKASYSLPALGVLWQKGTMKFPGDEALKDIQPTPLHTNNADEIQDWASKSFKYTITESVGYCNKVEGACTAAPARLSSDTAERERMKYKYYEKHALQLASRLIEAGIHMAGFIEQAMGE